MKAEIFHLITKKKKKTVSLSPFCEQRGTPYGLDLSVLHRVY